MTNPKSIEHTNPVLKSSTLPHGAPMWEEIKVEHFMPALDWALAKARENVAAIKSNPDAPTFENTIEALEFASDHFNQVHSYFSSLKNVKMNEEIEAIQDDFSDKAVAFSNEVSLDEALYERVKTVYNSDTSSLTSEQQKLLKDTYEGYVRGGADLSGKDKDRYREISMELARECNKFTNNVLKATKEIELYIDDESRLEGIPEDTKAALAEDAEKSGQKGKWRLTVAQSTVFKVLEHGKDRSLREEVWRAYSTRSQDGEFDNRPVIKRVLELRHEKAQLLGFDTHAAYILDSRMAKTTNTVEKMYADFITKVKPAAEKERADITAFARAKGGPGELKPWDRTYYTEMMRKEHFNFDGEEMRPYFQLDNVVNTMFNVYEKLFGYTFQEKTDDYQTYRDDITVYEMYDKEGNVKALFYMDFFEHTGEKTEGAWMDNYREQGVMHGNDEIPIIALHLNLKPKTRDKPVTLTFDDVITLYHESGHGMHGAASKCTYPSVSGTNVKWDFVELPSQFMENWAKRPDVLKAMGKHWETGEEVPDDLIKRMKDAEKFGEATGFMRQLTFGKLDMELHTTDPADINDIIAFEWDATEDYRLGGEVDEGGRMLPTLKHLFAGPVAYSAGYYSYKWAEILDADGYEYIDDRGGFDATDELQSYHDNILVVGGSREEGESWQAWMGRDPLPDALLRRAGILPVKNKTPSNQNKGSKRTPKVSP